MSSYSVVIIARNEEQHIKKSIESIFNQSIQPYQVVVVDDGSTDTTPDILSSMQVAVKKIPYYDRDVSIYSNTLSEIRNVGLACVLDDPVDWVYSGDADIILPPRYCETIMKHAEENDAYIGAGTVGKHLEELPTDACRMIKHDWLKSVGMKTKWESIYLCIMALVHGKNTLVCHADDCIAVTQRSFGEYTPDRQYGRGILAKRMGISLHLLLYSSVVSAKNYGVSAGYMFLKGGLGEKMDVPEDMGKMYRTMIRENCLRHFGRHHRMLDKRGKNMICHPPCTHAESRQ